VGSVPQPGIAPAQRSFGGKENPAFAVFFLKKPIAFAGASPLDRSRCHAVEHNLSKRKATN
jgi:hypothetical protein